MKIKKRYYRLIESLIKQIYKYKNSSQNINIDKAFKSAIYNTSADQKFLFLNDKKNKFTPVNIVNLFNKLKLKKDSYTDLLIL